MNHLREGLSQSWLRIQGSLFSWLQEELAPLTNMPTTRILLERLEFDKILRFLLGKKQSRKRLKANQRLKNQVALRKVMNAPRK